MATIRRSNIKHSGTTGTVYLLHFNPPYRHCQHYVGFTTQPISARLGEHYSGNGSGAALTEAALEAGCDLVLARVWEQVDQSVEFIVKSRAEGPKLCPICNPDTAMSLAQYDRKGNP